MLELVLAFSMVVATPVTDENGTGWRINKRSGLEFQHRVERNQRPVELSVQGPRIARDAYGLTFEIRF